MKFKLCIYCKSWFFDTGCSDYSELTPGEEFSTGCNIRKWAANGYGITQEELRKYFETAISCDDFDQIDELNKK